MNTVKVIRFLVFFLLGTGYLAIPGLGQPEGRLGNWVGATSSQRYSDYWKTFIQGEIRTWETFRNLNELLWRVAAQCDASPKVMLAMGYVRVDTWPYKNEPYRKFFENRFYQEFLHKAGWGQLKMNNRIRMEQRWITYPEGGTNYSNRFRYLLDFSYHFFNEKKNRKKWFGRVFNEIFLDFDRFDYWFQREAGKSGLNQNRLYGGVGYKFTSMSNLQFGLLWQHRPKSDFFRLFLGYAHNLDFRKRPKF